MSVMDERPARDTCEPGKTLPIGTDGNKRARNGTETRRRKEELWPKGKASLGEKEEEDATGMIVAAADYKPEKRRRYGCALAKK